MHSHLMDFVQCPVFHHDDRYSPDAQNTPGPHDGGEESSRGPAGWCGPGRETGCILVF